MVTSTTPTAQAPPSNSELISAIASALKQGAAPGGTGLNMSTDQVAQVLISQLPYITKLAAEGKFNEAQLAQVKNFLQIYQKTKPAPVAANATPNLKRKSPGSEPEPPKAPAATWTPATQRTAAGVSTNVVTATSSSGVNPVASSSQSQPQLAKPVSRGSLRKNSANDPAMRRLMQDLTAQVDPNYKLEANVEDLLLDIADEFIDSVTNFSCRLAKHRGGDKLEIRDLQLHLEKNHNIRIPGFAADMFAQQNNASASAPGATGAGAGAASSSAAAATTAASRRVTTAPTKRSARLAAVQAAKRDGR